MAHALTTRELNAELTDRPIRQPMKYYKALAMTRRAKWPNVLRDYHRWKDQDRADRLEDESIRRRAWDAYRAGEPAHQWRKGLQRKFARSFGDGDYDSIPGFDTLARDMAYEWPGHFGAPSGDYEGQADCDHARLLFDYLARPPLNRRPCHDVLLELIDKHARRQAAPEASFDVDEIEAAPDKLALARAYRSAREPQAKQPPARAFVEFPSNIGVLCLTDKQSLDPTIGGTGPEAAAARDGSKYVQLWPSTEPGKIFAVATNGKAVAMIQCTGYVDGPRLVPPAIAPKSGAKTLKPAIAVLDGDHWQTDKGIKCGRASESYVTFPELTIGVDSRAEGFSLEVDDIVKLAKALGAKRLGFYPAPGDANESPKLIAVLPMDPGAAIGAGVLVSQADYLPTAEEFASCLRYTLGMPDKPEQPDSRPSEPHQSAEEWQDDDDESDNPFIAAARLIG